MKKERQCTRSRAKENVALPDNAATQPTTMQTRFRAAMVSKAEDRFFFSLVSMPHKMFYIVLHKA